MSNSSGATIIVAGIFAVAAIGFKVPYQTMTQENETVTLTKIESVAKGKSGHEYRAYAVTKDGCRKTFRVSDAWFAGQFTAADLAGDLEQDKTYDVTHYGWRFGPFSMMENIIEAEVNENKGPFIRNKACKL